MMDVIGDRDFSINMISKSGTTTEPAVAFRVFKKMLRRNTAKKKLRRGFIAQQIKQEAHLRAWQQKRDMSHLSCLMM